MTSNNDTFITNKVTNADIYKKLIDIEAHVMKTNGRVTKSEGDIKTMWAIGGGAIVIFVGILLWIIQNVQYR